MSDDLLYIPQVPDAKPDDPEDVSWALSTAEAMWARGDHSEGIKWVRRAAEAASEADKDMRAVELAKAAADLQGMIARMSMADNERSSAAGASSAKPPPVPKSATPPANTSGPVSTVPTTSRSVPPISRGAPSTKQSAPPPAGKTAGRSIPPIPLPSKASSPPPGGSASKPPEAAPAKGAPRPVAAANKAQTPAAGKAVSANKSSADKKGRRRSRENLEDEAREAGVLDTAPNTALRPSDTDEIAALAADDAIPLSGKKNVPFDQDATMIGSRDAIERGRKRSADDWDKSPTQNAMPGDGAIDGGDRKTTVGVVAPSVTQQRAAPASMPPRAPRASPSIIPHDDSIKTSQAIRVVVWRDANGVHVAPEGTVVSAIKIDAMLVALEPTADLTAWLSRKDR